MKHPLLRTPYSSVRQRQPGKSGAIFFRDINKGRQHQLNAPQVSIKVERS